MLQTLRDKTTGWVAVAILVLLSVPFAFFGVENYFQAQVPTYVAKVNKVEIDQDQFRQRFEDHRSRMRQMLGPSSPASARSKASTRPATASTRRSRADWPMRRTPT